MAELVNKFIDSTGLKAMLNRLVEMYNSLKEKIESIGQYWYISDADLFTGDSDVPY